MSVLRTYVAAGLMVGSAAVVLAACSAFGTAPTEPVSDASVTDGAVSPVGDAIAVPADAGLVDQSAPLDAGPADASLDASDGGPALFGCTGWTVSDGVLTQLGGSAACMLCKMNNTKEALASRDLNVDPADFELASEVSFAGPTAVGVGGSKLALGVRPSGMPPLPDATEEALLSPMPYKAVVKVTTPTNATLTLKLGVTGNAATCAKFDRITLTRR